MSSYPSSSSCPSTPSLVSVTTITSATSSTPLRHPTPPSSSTQTQKDYAAAFSVLQSQYGWGPVTPIPIQNRKDKESRQKKQNESRKKETQSSVTSPCKSSEELEPEERQGESRERVFGSLSSKFGFGGSWPTPVHRK